MLAYKLMKLVIRDNGMCRDKTIEILTSDSEEVAEKNKKNLLSLADFFNGLEPGLQLRSRPLVGHCTAIVLCDGKEITE